MERTQACAKCGKKILEGNLIVHEAQCRGKSATPSRPASQASAKNFPSAQTSAANLSPAQTSAANLPPAQTSAANLSSAQKTTSRLVPSNEEFWGLPASQPGVLPSAPNDYRPQLSSNPPPAPPRVSSQSTLNSQATPLSTPKQPPRQARPNPALLEPIRCPKCTEYISVERYEDHLQTCPNDYCSYCREPFPKMYLQDHKANCPQRSARSQRQRPTNNTSTPAAAGRQVTTRQVGPDTMETVTVESMPGGSQRMTVERQGPHGRQVNVSVVPNRQPQPGGGMGALFGRMLSQPELEEEDPFELLFIDHRRFMQLNRPTLRRQVIDLETLLMVLMGRARPQQQGLRREAIDKIEKVRFSRNAETRAGEEEKCPICIAEFADGEELRRLPCKHWFHPECVDTWLVQNSSCPICKADMKDRL